MPAEDDLAFGFVGLNTDLRYVAAWGKWLAYDAGRWAEDQVLDVFSRVRDHLRSQAEGNQKHRGQLLKANTVAAVERLARSDRRIAATVDQWDAHDHLLNTPSGIVNLRIGAHRPHDPGKYLTKMAAASPGGDCTRWNRFLREVTGDDDALAKFLQRVAGYAATGFTQEHALLFFYGTGGNGKGVFLNTLQGVLADYAAVAPMEVFTESHTDRHPTELAMLRGARLVVAQETEEGRRWAESRIKAMSAADPITARFMRQDFFTFVPRFKLLIAGNHKPSLRHVDEAIRRRLHLIPFTVTIPPDKRDTRLAETLKAEWSGILNWIIEGARAYFAEGLAPPPVVVQATQDYFTAEDVFSQWLEDRCERGAEYWDPASRLFASWKRYAEDANTRAGDQKAFAHRMEAAGFERGNTGSKGGRHWNGVKLRPAVYPDDDAATYR